MIEENSRREPRRLQILRPLGRRRSDADARRFRRGVYLLPSMFTMANLFCGYACIVHAMRGDLERAALFIGFAFVLDMLDGRIARLTGTTSAFGVEFDSLVLPTGKLAAVAGQRDASNNQVFAPEKKVELEGRRMHYVYLLPEGTAPLAVIRNYQNAANDLWYSVDNVEVVVDIANPCSTAAAPAPTKALGAARADDAGTQIAVTWDATCGASQYNLIWGDLAAVSGYAVSGGVCALGTAGSATWHCSAPAGATSRSIRSCGATG